MNHCPYRQTRLLQQSLSSEKMRVAFFIGAGCPMAIRKPDGQPLIPDIRALTKLVRDKMEADKKFAPSFKEILSHYEGESPTIEHILSHLRQLCEIMIKDDLFGLSKTDLINLDREICKLITSVVRENLSPGGQSPYHQLARWVNGIPRTHAVDIFTTNYDLLFEQALEESRVPYFDGFVGSRRAFFDISAIENDILPSRWARLWKLHGSVNWWRTQSGHVERIGDPDSEEQQMIFPSHLKYDQSRRLPYLAMLDRLKDFLAPSRGQAVLITCGYSFADDHLNEVIFQGLSGNANAVCFGLSFGTISSNSSAVNCAKENANLRLLASDGAVLNTVEGSWISGPSSHEINSLQAIAVEEIPRPDLGNDPLSFERRFCLGDFAKFGEFLANQLEDRHQTVAENGGH